MTITTKYNVGDVVWIWYTGYGDKEPVVTRTIVTKVETNTSDKDGIPTTTIEYTTQATSREQFESDVYASREEALAAKDLYNDR